MQNVCYSKVLVSMTFCTVDHCISLNIIRQCYICTPEYIITNLQYNYVTMLKYPAKDVGPLQPFHLHVWRYVPLS